jgi:hypothetical protein
MHGIKRKRVTKIEEANVFTSRAKNLSIIIFIVEMFPLFICGIRGTTRRGHMTTFQLK